jgi:hypothetical protein
MSSFEHRHRVAVAVQRQERRRRRGAFFATLAGLSLATVAGLATVASVKHAKTGDPASVGFLVFCAGTTAAAVVCSAGAASEA